MARSRLDSKTLFRRLARRTPGNAEAFDLAVRREVERDLAILVADSSGFTRRVLESGILDFLAALQRCREAVLPVLRANGGRLFGVHGDNLMLTYPDALAAARAARDTQRLLRRRNRRLPAAERFHLCIGIDAGPVLDLADDVYGSAVNLASKLGEDLAERDEILLTGEAVHRLKGRFRTIYSRSTQAGGHLVELHRLPY